MPAISQAAVHWYKCEPKAAGKYHDPDCTEKAAGNFELTKLPFEVGGVVAKTEVSSFGVLTFAVPAVPITVKCNVLDEGAVWNTVVEKNGLDEVTLFTNHKCLAAPACAGVTVTAVALPWASELQPGPPIRDKIKGIQITVNCPGVLNEAFAGELEPKVVNNSPSYLEFGAGSGGLKSVGAGELTVAGKDFVQDFATAENIDAE
jgi:hypothetical protein